MQHLPLQRSSPIIEDRCSQTLLQLHAWLALAIVLVLLRLFLDPGEDDGV